MDKICYLMSVPLIVYDV